MTLQVIDKATGKMHEVAKYFKSSDDDEGVWCHDWPGRHRIGYECEWYTGKQEPYNDDQYPDLSSAPASVKHETITGLIQVVAKQVMKMFYAFGLKTHIECTVINDPTNDEFEFVFRKKGIKDSWNNLILFHNWMKETGWTRHDYGDYYYRSNDHHQWPPDETCDEKELIDKYIADRSDRKC